MDLYNQIGKNIQILRTKKGKSLEMVVSTLNQRGGTFTVEVLKEIENGEWAISIPLLHHLGEILGCSIEDFMDGIEEEKSLVEQLEESMGKLSVEERIFFEELEMIAHSLIGQEKIHNGERSPMRPALWKYTRDLPNPYLTSRTAQ